MKRKVGMKATNNIKGVELFRKGEIDGAITKFTSILEQGYDRYACTNLGFISSFHADSVQLTQIYDWFKNIDCDHVSLLKLKLSIGLAIGIDETIVYDQYIKPYVAPFSPSIVSKPIFLFHIPKCGGTTLSKSLTDHFYQSNYDILPKYFEAQLLKFCIQQAYHYFPFLSSQHMDYQFMDIDLKEFRSLCVFRDPLKRVLSALRQTVAANRQGYSDNVLPKYGSFWHYYNCDSLQDWLAKSPKSELCKQISTFSQQLHLGDAKARIDPIDGCFSLDRSDCYLQIERFLDLRPKSTFDFNQKANASDKKLDIDLNGMELATELLATESNLLTEIFSER